MTWMFNDDLFDVPAVEVLSKRFEQTLRSIVMDPEARLSAVEIRTVDERERMSRESAARRDERQRARVERLGRIRGAAPAETERPWTT